MKTLKKIVRHTLLTLLAVGLALAPVFVFSTSPVNAASGVLDTATYDAFGCLVQVSDTLSFHFYRQATAHESSGEGVVVGRSYNMSTRTWGSVFSVYAEAGFDMGNVGGGVIGTHIYLFFSKYQLDGTYVDVGYIVSDDLTGVAWSARTLVATPGFQLTNCYTGPMVATSVLGTYLKPFGGESTGGADYGSLGAVFKTTDYGTTWVMGSTIYSNPIQYFAEPAIAYIGDSKLIALVRDSTDIARGFLDEGGYMLQSISSDDGETWSDLEVTNLGNIAGKKPPVILYDPEYDDVIVSFQDRVGVGFTRVYHGAADAVFDNPQAWVDETVIDSGFIYNGYGSMLKIGTGEYLIVYSKEINAGDADICWYEQSYSDVPSSAVWWNASWSYRDSVSFDTVGVSADFANCPVVVTLDSTNFNFSRSQSNGEDIRFVDNDNVTELPYLITSWDDVGETASIVVRVPEILCGQQFTQSIYMYYGNVLAVDNQWAADDVLYPPYIDGELSNVPLYGLTASSYNSTDIYRLPVTAANTTWSVYGHDFDSSANSTVVVDDISFIQGVFETGATVIAWIKPDSDGGGDTGRIADKTDLEQYGWLFFVREQSGGNVKLAFTQQFLLAGGSWKTTDTVIPLGSYSCVAISYNGTSTANNPLFYLNGSNIADITESVTPNGDFRSDDGKDLIIGNVVTGTRGFDGVIGEFWLYNYIMTPDEIADASELISWRHDTGNVLVEHPPLSLSTLAASNVYMSDGTYATLRGQLSNLGGVPTADLWFEWGYDTSYGGIAGTQVVATTGTYTSDISGYDPTRTVYYRIAGSSVDGTVYGAAETFTLTGGSSLGMVLLYRIGLTVVACAILIGVFLTFRVAGPVAGLTAATIGLIAFVIVETWLRSLW